MEPVYITYSAEVRKALQGPDIDLPALVTKQLAAENIQGKASWASNPTESEGSEKRDLVLLILAAGVAAPMVAAAVARVIDALTNRKVQLKGEQTVNVTFGSDGKPVSATATSKAGSVPKQEEHHKLSVAKVFDYDYSRSS